MFAEIDGVKVEMTVDEFLELQNKVGKKTKDKFFNIPEGVKPFKEDDPYSEHRNIIYTNQGKEEKYPYPSVKFVIKLNKDNNFLVDELTEAFSKLSNRGVKF